ncbi:MAG: STAS domain-containing protein [Acidobacteriia bacterium]|nr:STAS domain-containing protein [Terriglobia bacterium]
MKELKIESETGTSGVRIFRLIGPLTLASVFEFQDLARSDHDAATVIDLSGVPYMDSAGLGAILGIMASCQRKSRGFGITGATERIQTLFTVAGVSGLIPSFDSVELAERQLSNAASA